MDTPVGTVGRLLTEGDSNILQRVLENQTKKAAATHATDFEPPLYNVWKRQEKIFDLWLSCHTQDEIAGVVRLTHQAVSKIQDGFATSVLENQSCKASATHATEFDLEKF